MTRAGGRYRLGWLVFLGALQGCAPEAVCREEGGASIDDGIDAAVTRAPTDSGSDAAADEDASTARCTVPTALYVGPLVRVESPTSAVGCAPGAGRIVRIRIFRRGEAVPMLDREGPCETVLAVGRVLRGDYELALESDGFVAGASLIHPEHCSASDPSDDVFCNPIPLPLSGCGAFTVTAAIYCDPALGPCEAYRWPW